MICVFSVRQKSVRAVVSKAGGREKKANGVTNMDGRAAPSATK